MEEDGKVSTQFVHATAKVNGNNLASNNIVIMIGVVIVLPFVMVFYHEMFYNTSLRTYLMLL